MKQEYLVIENAGSLHGTVHVDGAKNAVLVIIASLILTTGKSRLHNVPASADVYQMIALLKNLGADILFDAENNILEVDTHALNAYTVGPEIMKKMRASILVMGPLLARFGRAHIALPGGCVLGTRPIDFHLKAFARMGTHIEIVDEFLNATVSRVLTPCRFVLDYPSVGATENIIMAAALTPGTTCIINAALEPEVFDLMNVLGKMGARIIVRPPAMIEIEGVETLQPIEHTIMPDRLEAGTLLLAAAMTHGEIFIPNAKADELEVFLEKLSEMGHEISTGIANVGIRLKATPCPRAVSFKTMPYPGFPTDLQAPMMAAQCLASGTSIIDETVYENRLVHVRELQKMGAHIVVSGTTATIKGVEALYGTQVIASDIRASVALILAGLAAQGPTQTMMTGIQHVRRGYQNLELKLQKLGAHIKLVASE
ncbi:MAG: UDP-N-acetylglucosamine 1-carboxyvinyltransferase [Candidatus Babeliaceae bacterium]